MFDHNKCPQDTDCYCPHYKEECNSAKSDGVMCVHIKASMQATLTMTAMRAMVRNTTQESIVAEAIKERLESMGIAEQLKKMPWQHGQ